MKFIVSKARPRVRLKGLGGRYYKVWSKRGLSEDLNQNNWPTAPASNDAITIASGDVPAPDPTLIAQELGPYGQGIATQAALTQMVVQDANAQVRADMPILLRPATSAGSSFFTQPIIAGSNIPTWLPLGGAGLLVLLAAFGGGKRR